MRSDLMTRLKEETRAHHDHLEAHAFATSTLMNDAITHDVYRDILCAFYGFHAPLEEAIQAHAGLATLPLDMPARRKRHLLEADLRALGLTDEDVAALPTCTDLPNIADTAAALGSLYVIEGSTLGGRVITRQLADTLGVTPEAGSAFFAGYGEQTGPMWMAYSMAATNHGADQAQADMMVAAAIDTFRHFDLWLDAVTKSEEAVTYRADPKRASQKPF